MLKDEKKAQRTEIKALLKTMEKKEIHLASLELHKQLINTHYWEKAGLVLTYLSTGSEVVTDAHIIQALQSGKKLGVPRIHGDDLVFHAISEHDHSQYIYNQYRIPEPCPEHHQIIDEQFIGNNHVLLLTPGLAFDKQKGRLGKGKGYYDRSIRELRTLLGDKLVVMGICFDIQLVEQVIRGSWDESVDVVLTEKKCI